MDLKQFDLPFFKSNDKISKTYKSEIKTKLKQIFAMLNGTESMVNDDTGCCTSANHVAVQTTDNSIDVLMLQKEFTRFFINLLIQVFDFSTVLMKIYQ